MVPKFFAGQMVRVYTHHYEGHTSAEWARVAYMGVSRVCVTFLDGRREMVCPARVDQNGSAWAASKEQRSAA